MKPSTDDSWSSPQDESLIDDPMNSPNPRFRYRVCRVGFGFAALGLGLLGLSGACELYTIVSGNRALVPILQTPAWDWIVSAPITWATLLGSILLLNRWPDRAWKTRAGLLVAMNSVDFVLWCLDHAEVFGFPPIRRRGEPDVFRTILGPFMNLAELVLFADLAHEVSLHLGHRDSEATRRFVKVASGISLVLWLVVVSNQLRWRPLRFNWRFRDLDTFFMYLGSELTLVVAAFLVTVLSGMAARQCTAVLADIDRSERESDPLKSRSNWEDLS